MDFLDSNVSGCARHSASELGSALTGTESLNFNSVVIDNVAMRPSIETLPGYEARAAFLCSGKALRGNPVNSASVFREDVDIVPTIRR